MRTESPPGWSKAHLGLILLLMAAYTAGYAWSTPSADTADELLRAYEIRHGLAYPLEGPFLGGALHLGPLWFYLTALPLWISHSWLSVALFVGFVCSLKFPLAYVCGRKLLDADFGLLWAAAMFLPGWSSLEPLVFLNPNAVATAALLVVAISLHAMVAKVERPTYAMLGLALATALHVHPTSVPVFVLVAPVLWVRHQSGGSLAGPALAMVAGFLVPFVPYAISEIRGGVPDWGSAATYVSGRIFLANIVNAPAIVLDYLFAGPATVAQYLMHWRSDHAAILGGATALAAATCVAASFHRISRRPLLLFVAALLLFSAWIACARPTTPFQFTWMLGPVLAGLIALGFWALGRSRASRFVVGSIVAASVIVNLFAIRAMALRVWEGEGQLPSRVMDIKDQLPKSIYRDVWFPALSHGELGRILCETGEVSLHGHLAYIVDKDLGLDTLFVCSDRSRLSLVGGEAPTHYFGMTRVFWKAIGASPECWAGSLGLTRRITPLVPRAPLALADGATYMPRQVAGKPPIEMVVPVTAPGDAAIMVTNVLGGYEPFQIVTAAASGQIVQPLAGNDLSSLFVSPARASDAIPWTFTIMTTNPSGIDMVAIHGAWHRGSETCSSGPGK